MYTLLNAHARCVVLAVLENQVKGVKILNHLNLDEEKGNKQKRWGVLNKPGAIIELV